LRPAQSKTARAAATAAALAACLLAVLIVGGCGNSDGDDQSEGTGPIKLGSPHGWSYTTADGSVFTDGLEVLHLTTDDTATIDKIELVGDDGLELVGAKIAPPPRPLLSTQLVKRWPPVEKGSFDPSTLEDAVGATFGGEAEKSSMGWELLVGIRVNGEGILHRDGIRVSYHIGSHSYAATIPAELNVCTDKSYEKDGDCPFDA
jgi:hypothetical protein